MFRIYNSFIERKALSKTLTAFTLFAAALFSNEKETLCHPCDYQSGYNAPYKNYKTYDIFVDGSALLWQPKEQGMDIALFDTTNKVNPSKILNTHFEYSPGFRITLGSNFLDAWDAWIDYTQLKTENGMSKRSDLSSSSIINYWSFNNFQLNEIKSKWGLSLKIFDLSFGRSYFVGKKLIFNPFFGLKFGKINQKIKVSSTSLTNSFLFKNSYTSNLIGPRLGIKTRWLLGSGFSFLCDCSASLFAQHFNLKLVERDSNAFLYMAKTREKSVNTNVDILTSFDWSHNWRNKWSLYLSAGYEMQLFWDQNRMRSFVEELKNTTNLESGNLMPHGFTFSLKFSF